MTFFRIEQKAICQENMKVTKKSFTNFLKEMSLLDFNSQIHKRNKINLNAKFIDQCWFLHRPFPFPRWKLYFPSSSLNTTGRWCMRRNWWLPRLFQNRIHIHSCDYRNKYINSQIISFMLTQNLLLAGKQTSGVLERDRWRDLRLRKQLHSKAPKWNEHRRPDACTYIGGSWTCRARRWILKSLRKLWWLRKLLMPGSNRVIPRQQKGQLPARQRRQTDCGVYIFLNETILLNIEFQSIQQSVFKRTPFLIIVTVGKGSLLWWRGRSENELHVFLKDARVDVQISRWNFIEN